MLFSLEESRKIYEHIKVSSDGTQRFIDDGSVTKEYRELIRRIDAQNKEFEGEHFVINIDEV